MFQSLMKMRSWWMRTVGRRGSALLFFSFLDSFYCWNLLTLPELSKKSDTFKFIDGLAPIEVWASAWGFAGLLCFVYAFRRTDGVGFAAAMALYLLWGLIYVAGDVTGDIYRGYVSSSVWFALVLFVWLISGWPEYPGGDRWRTQDLSSRESP